VSPRSTVAPTQRPLRLRSALAVLLLIAAIFVFWTNAWISDDAFITFRSVEQLAAGHGPRWNPDARVQVFTHPLWFLLLAGARLVTADLFWAALALSFALALVTLGVAARGAARERSLARAALLVVLLLSSKAFVDFSSSGLENPLSALLLALLILAAVEPGSRLARPARSDRGFFALVALLVLCRPDFLLLVAPAGWSRLRTAVVRRGRAGAALDLAIGMVPLVAWTAFAVVYYGFPVPNTAFAKLGSGVPRLELMAQGLRYLWVLARWDPLSLSILVGGTVALARRRATSAWALGLGAYLVYLIWIGGDFMAGRFFQPLVLIAAIAAARHIPARWTIPVLVVAVAASLLLPRGPLAFSLQSFRDREYGLQHISGVADEKLYYFPLTSALHPTLLGSPRPRRDALKVEKHRIIGWNGYSAPLDTIVVDEAALADPLLARLPALPPWRIGHFKRPLPAGYLETLRTGENHLLDPPVRRLWEQLALVTRGPLFTWERWRAILALNLNPPSLRDVHLAHYDLHVDRGDWQIRASRQGGALERMEASGTRLEIAGTMPFSVFAPEIWILVLSPEQPERARLEDPRQDPEGQATFALGLDYGSEAAAGRALRSCVLVRSENVPWILVGPRTAGCEALLEHRPQGAASPRR